MASKPKAVAPKVEAPKANLPAAAKDFGIVQSDQVPDYVKQSARGSEQVGTEDLVIPRLEIVQALSPAVKPGDPGFIEGAKIGMLNNSVTRQIYGTEVFVVPVSYTKMWLVWKDRKQGGGFYGSYHSPEEAKDAATTRAKEDKIDPSVLQIIDTPQHLCLLMNKHSGKIEEIMIPMPRTKAKISRQWNSMIKLAGVDRFGRVYKVGTQNAKNAKGDFYNFTVAASGFPTKHLYDMAEQFYKQIAAGRKVVMDVTGMDVTTDPDDDATPEM
jgi:hypothetical protein